jgi:hypothetical protein
LTTASYRQTSIAIARRQITIIARPFDQYSTTNNSENTLLLSIAHQAGHTIRTLKDSHAIDKAYPTRLEPELIRQYENTSIQWHQWLRISELEQKFKRTRQLQHRYAGLAKVERLQSLQEQASEHLAEQLSDQLHRLPNSPAEVQQESTPRL